MTLSGTSEVSRFVRPVELPEDVAMALSRRPLGLIRLPLQFRWSGPPKTYDHDDRRDRSRVDERVLQEGPQRRIFADIYELLDLWDDLVLPQ